MASQLVKKSMRLFGLPYQFTKAVDPRINNISKTVGNTYMKNIMLEAPVCTLIPGVPNYLPADKSTDKKVSTSALLLEAAANGGFKSVTNLLGGAKSEQFRLYDFKRSYNEYMKYVNVLCRAGATFLELNTKIDGTNLQQYDWRNYRQTSTSYSSMVGRISKSAANSIKKKATQGVNNVSKAVTGKSFLYETDTMTDQEQEEIEDKLANYNFVQFYIDPDVSCTEDISNNTSESQLKSMFDSGSNFLKEIAFMANSGGIDTDALKEFTESSMDSLRSGIQSVLGTNGITGQVSSVLSRIINLGSEVVKGNNVIMPDIYQNSNYSKSYSITVHLKTPYGTKLGYYMDVFVPMMHLLALALPSQESANTYGSPFLVKAYVEGVFTCNMGIVSSIQINKLSDGWSVDGLPSEVDVTLNIVDLYSDLTMNKQSDPILFVNNSSLIEYLATNCGLSIVAPNLEAKTKLTVNTITNAFKDIPSNVTSGIIEAIDNEISKFTGLTW